MSLLPVPYQIKWLVDAVGEDRAFLFIETCGGQRLSVAGPNYRNSNAARTWGEDLARALAEHHGGEQWDVPLLKAWRARYLYLHGYSYNEITHRLGMGRACVRRYIVSAKNMMNKERNQIHETNQFSLFD